MKAAQQGDTYAARADEVRAIIRTILAKAQFTG
jgi:hypothetical protein